LTTLNRQNAQTHSSEIYIIISHWTFLCFGPHRTIVRGSNQSSIA